jgi:hypothetical protein
MEQGSKRSGVVTREAAVDPPERDQVSLNREYALAYCF